MKNGKYKTQETQKKQEMSNRDYQEYVNQQSPNSKLGKDLVWAFAVGGLICVVGQAVSDGFRLAGLDQEGVACCTSIAMVFLGALFTGLGVYDKLAKHAGAGTLVPITGFANAIVSPAMEFKSEGLVLGLAAKMFVVAGPVLVYGITASTAVGLISFLLGLL